VPIPCVCGRTERTHVWLDMEFLVDFFSGPKFFLSKAFKAMFLWALDSFHL
jgi:hypothetical protein